MTRLPRNSTQRLAALDGVRGLAALSVLVFHSWLYTRVIPTASARDTVLDYAVHELRLGLVLFFVLSGYLIWRPWLAAGMRRSEAPAVCGYLVRRFARVAPAYYVALAGALVLVWIAEGTPGVRMPDASALPLFLVFAQNYFDDPLMGLDPPMWTLVIEVSFYLLVPLVAFATLRASPRRAVQALLPLALLGVGVWWNFRIAGSGSPVAGKVLPAMLPYFAVGMLVAVVLEGREVGRRLAWLLVAAGLALVVGDAAWHAHAGATHSSSYAYRIWRDLPAACGFAAIVAALVGGRHAGSRVLGSRPLVGLGTISYSLYLWHVPVLLFMRHLGLLPMHTLPAALLVLALAGAIAAASWRWVERPAIARARTWQRSRRARAPDRAPGRRRGPAGRRADAPAPSSRGQVPERA